ncbi:zinc finger protein CONSTANS-LIKE 15-like [Dorcoceras hygrometricum]|uniref:Zinc finger protein CONSTANS-LIKE 15-like n=1 Tax=Dorcoceras hygrometricum TaxID=472368 RepID=A0A2Z7B071_9LAMI|nr:zinc finger protein CONSTANS-LIKE 15-like [Dorcoceras hygrometricum]
MSSARERRDLFCGFMRWFQNAAVLISCYVVVFGSNTVERSVRSDELLSIGCIHVFIYLHFRSLVLYLGLLCLVYCAVVFLPGCEGERRYRTLISLLGSLATMRRVVNYHSSWVRQRQVELFDASDLSNTQDLDHTLNRFGTYPNDVAPRTARSLGHVIPLTTSETLNDIASRPPRRYQNVAASQPISEGSDLIPTLTSDR